MTKHESNSNRQAARRHIRGKDRKKPAPAATLRRQLVLYFLCVLPLCFALLMLLGWWYLLGLTASSAEDLLLQETVAYAPDNAENDNEDDDWELYKLKQSLIGQLPSFEVDCVDADLGDLSCELLKLNANRVEFNVKEVLEGEQAKISSFDSAELSIRISSDELRRHLVPLIESKGIREPKIVFGNGTVKVTGKKKIKLIGSVKISAKGDFHVSGDNRFVFSLSELESGQFNIGVSSLGYSFEEELPPLNLGNMYARIVIDRLDVRSGFLQLDAHAAAMDQGIVPTNAIDLL